MAMIALNKSNFPHAHMYTFNPQRTDDTVVTAVSVAETDEMLHDVNHAEPWTMCLSLQITLLLFLHATFNES